MLPHDPTPDRGGIWQTPPRTAPAHGHALAPGALLHAQAAKIPRPHSALPCAAGGARQGADGHARCPASGCRGPHAGARARPAPGGGQSRGTRTRVRLIPHSCCPPRPRGVRGPDRGPRRRARAKGGLRAGAGGPARVARPRPKRHAPATLRRRRGAVPPLPVSPRTLFADPPQAMPREGAALRKKNEKKKIESHEHHTNFLHNLETQLPPRARVRQLHLVKLEGAARRPLVRRGNRPTAVDRGRTAVSSGAHARPTRRRWVDCDGCACA